MSNNAQLLIDKTSQLVSPKSGPTFARPQSSFTTAATVQLSVLHYSGGPIATHSLAVTQNTVTIQALQIKVISRVGFFVDDTNPGPFQQQDVSCCCFVVVIKY